MKEHENSDNKKGGFLAALSKFFGSSPASSGGAASGIGTAASGFGGGLFASKAVIANVVLGGIIIASGAGIVHNFIGPSSKPAYSPNLFESQYYEAAAEKASAERIADSNGAGAAYSSSLDYFKGEVEKDGIELGEGGSEGADSEGGAASADGDDSYSSSAGGEAGEGGNDYGANASMSDAPKLQKAPGFGSGGGAQSKLTLGGAGMSGGIGSKFQKIYKAPPAGPGRKTSSMKGSLAAKINKSSKYSPPNLGGKKAYGQLRATKSISAAAVGKTSMSGQKSVSQAAFSGKNEGEGDVGAPDGGAGLGGAGISGGSSLKSSDPNYSSSEPTPPPASPEPEDASPWKKYTNMALYAGLAWGVCILLAKCCKGLWGVGFAIGAMVAAAVVIFAGVMMMAKYGQKMMGIMYIAAGCVMMYLAITAAMGGGGGSSGGGGGRGGAGNAGNTIALK
ncbi:MAG: hypothetical protein L6420_11510 [Elusimicrobia bacterium]|nr:hypothetical protein [Elusimicrobiota bacterium]